MQAARRFAEPTMPLSELLGDVNAALADTTIGGMQLDSRKIQPGDLFLALPGEIHDGRQFIEQAVANGASAVVAEAPVAGFVDGVAVPMVEIPDLRFEVGMLASRFYANPSAQLHVVGVTGTNGKTTTSRMIAQLSRALGRSCGVIGTLGATLADDVSAAANTTPDALAVQRQLAQWQQLAVENVSLEVSSHALVQGRVNGVSFDSAIFTNLSQDHLDYHGSMEAYGRAKLQLFSDANLSCAIINADDPFSSRVRAVVAAGVNVVTYSVRDAAADVRVRGAQFSVDGVRGELHTPWGTAEFFSPVAGTFNLQNLAAAVAALLFSGEDFSAVMDALVALRPVPGRMQTIPNALNLQVIVDYAHTPDALEQLLKALRPHVAGALIVLFGCGGDRDMTKRQLMGRVACALADHAIVTSDNPRSEEPEKILGDIASGCTGSYVLIEDRAQAIAGAIAELNPGDCLVIAGKGHEEYQLIGDARLFFSDASHAHDALMQRAAL